MKEERKSEKANENINGLFKMNNRNKTINDTKKIIGKWLELKVK